MGKLMKLIKLLLLNIFLIITMTGCDRLGGGGVAVIDLTAVSKATGQDEVMIGQMEKATAELNVQLTEAAATLEKQLAEKKEKFGKKASQEQQQELQQFALNAGQQLKQNQAVAQQKAQQYKMGLILSWRQQIQPAVDEAARKHNAKVVLVASTSLMWFDASIDITSEVIAALRAQPIKAAVPDTDVSGDETEKSE
jgi:Skp family chaperone for outer membrane proteins